MSLISYHAPVVESTTDGRGRVVVPMPAERVGSPTAPPPRRVGSGFSGSSSDNIFTRATSSYRGGYIDAANAAAAQRGSSAGSTRGSNAPWWATGRSAAIEYRRRYIESARSAAGARGGAAGEEARREAEAGGGGMTQPGAATAAANGEEGMASMQSWALLAGVGVVAWFLLAS